MPKQLWAELKIEADVEPRHVTIVEVRRPWDGDGAPTRLPIARLGYASSTGLWSLFWRDGSLRFHQYKGTQPTRDVQVLLDHLDSSADPIFWG